MTDRYSDRIITDDLAPFLLPLANECWLSLDQDSGSKIPSQQVQHRGKTKPKSFRVQEETKTNCEYYNTSPM